MNYRLFKRSQNNRLLLVFAGWGMDDTPLTPLLGESNSAIVWDYTDLSTPLPFLSTFTEIHLIAWSMGVWAATQVLNTFPLASATALNGTPFPIDDTRGIPNAIFDATLNEFSTKGLERFRRRMCGSTEALNTFLKQAPTRTLEDLRCELASLSHAIRTNPSQPFHWTRAIACEQDRIFPCAHQCNAFPTALVRPGAHWMPELFQKLLHEENL